MPQRNMGLTKTKQKRTDNYMDSQSSNCLDFMDYLNLDLLAITYNLQRKNIMNLTKKFPKMSTNDWRKLQLSTDAKNQRDWASRQLHDMENDPDNFTLTRLFKGQSWI